MWNTPTTVKFSNISATPAAFTLRGGEYGITVIGSGFGTVKLQRLAPDASTYVDTGVSFTANGFTTFIVPNGTYQLSVATATAVYADIVPIVQDQ